MSMLETVHVAGVAYARAAVSVRATMRNVRIVLGIASPPSGPMPLLLLVLGQRQDVLFAHEVAVLDELGLGEVARLGELDRDGEIWVAGVEQRHVGTPALGGEGEAVALATEHQGESTVMATRAPGGAVHRERALGDHHPAVLGRRQRQGH